MTTTVPRPEPVTSRPYPTRITVKGSTLLELFQMTDHKVIGMLYLGTSMAFFFVGGSMAMLIRGELARPSLQFLSNEQYNQLFTMHGTIMLLLYATPILFTRSLIWCYRCRLAPRMSLSPGSMRSPTGCSSSVAWW